MNEYKIINNKMKFSVKFDKPLDNYNKIIKDNNITYLDFYCSYIFNQPIDNLQISFFKGKKKFINRRNKPWYIKSCYLPNSITHLRLGEYFNQKIDNLNLPNSITHLILGNYNKRIDNLPNNITHLILEGIFNKPINNLPLRLKEIDIRQCIFKESIKENLLDIIPINCKIID
jgi:hypothetical protein